MSSPSTHLAETFLAVEGGFDSTLLLLTDDFLLAKQLRRRIKSLEEEKRIRTESRALLGHRSTCKSAAGMHANDQKR